MKDKYTLFLIVVALIMVSIPILEINAHPGRKDASGCHTETATGEYHCHNGNSDSGSSSSNNSYQETESVKEEYRYKDSDSNGINDYTQNRTSLAKNIRTMGEEMGTYEAQIRGYNPTNDYDFTAEEFEWYKAGYDKGYYQKLAEDAWRDGYANGNVSDELTIPEKYTILEKIKQEYINGFRKGQESRWHGIALVSAKTFTVIVFPNNVPQDIMESTKALYKKETERLKQKAYDDGYQSAFIHKELKIPTKFHNIPPLIAEYEKGFHANTEVKELLHDAYVAGKSLDNYSAPFQASMYMENYMEGRQKTLVMYTAGVASVVGFGIIFLIIRWKRRTNN